MLYHNTKIGVTNRDRGNVGYLIPDMNNLKRDFAPGETKQLTFDELQKLSYVPGGLTLLREYLILDNAEALEALLNQTVDTIEPEYFYTEEDVKNLLLKGSLDQLLDCLDFAPTGVIDLIKDQSVKLKLNDLQKRQAIFEKTGFNVDNAIRLTEETAGSEETQNANPSRRTAAMAPKYKVK